MTKDLILERATTRELFMAALLLCTSQFKGANVRLLEKEEEKSCVNVTPENIYNLCPSWASSELMTRMIEFKVCAPAIDNPMLSVSEKVHEIKESLKNHAKKEGIEMPI